MLHLASITDAQDVIPLYADRFDKLIDIALGRRSTNNPCNAEDK